MAINVVIIDDSDPVREAFRSVLLREADMRIVGEAATACAAFAVVKKAMPDVVVLDVGRPEAGGVGVAAHLRRLPRPPRIVAVSGFATGGSIGGVLRAGAHAYVSMSAAASELVRAVRAARSGNTYVYVEGAAALAEDEGEAATAQLSRRELEVVRLIAQGRRSRAIAEAMHISVTTVQVHRRNIVRKLDLHSVAQLTTWAIRQGILSI